MGLYSIFLGVDSVCRCPTWLLSWFFQLGLKLGDNPIYAVFFFSGGGTSNITFGGTVVPDFPTKLSISGPGRSMQCSLSPVRAGASCFVSFFALAKFQIRVGENRWKQIIFEVRIACFQSSPMLQKPFGPKFWRLLGQIGTYWNCQDEASASGKEDVWPHIQMRPVARVFPESSRNRNPGKHGEARFHCQVLFSLATAFVACRTYEFSCQESARNREPNIMWSVSVGAKECSSGALAKVAFLLTWVWLKIEYPKKYHKMWCFINFMPNKIV